MTTILLALKGGFIRTRWDVPNVLSRGNAFVARLRGVKCDEERYLAVNGAKSRQTERWRHFQARRLLLDMTVSTCGDYPFTGNARRDWRTIRIRVPYNMESRGKSKAFKTIYGLV